MMRPGRQKWLLVLVAILFLTNIATITFIWLKNPRPGKEQNEPGKQKERRMGQFMVDQLKFDTVQEASYWKMRDTLVAIQRPLMDSIRNSKTAFFDLLNQPNNSDSALVAHANEIAALQKRLDLVTFRHFQKVRAICRPDQLQKFDTVIKEIVNRMTPFRRNRQNDSTSKK